MYDQWMPKVTLSLTEEQFGQLPRNPAYQYDYLHGQAILSPSPKHFHGVLDFSRWQAPEPDEISEKIKFRSIYLGDRAGLSAIFAEAFEGVQPFSGLTSEQRLGAARMILDKTWQGYDGPWMRQASFTAVHGANKTLLGGITITLVPGGNPEDADCYCWQEPPGNLWHKGLAGQPHLTWIFVSPLWKGVGIASALLSNAVDALRKLGFTNLWTTFMLGNDASMLWHWRNGFTLAPLPLSRRTLRQGIPKR